MRTHTSRPCTTLCRTSLTLLLAVLLAAAQPAPPALASTANDASARQTFEIFQAIPGLSADQLAQGQAVIGGMHYNAQRIFRTVCALPGVTFDQARQVADHAPGGAGGACGAGSGCVARQPRGRMKGAAAAGRSLATSCTAPGGRCGRRCTRTGVVAFMAFP